MRWFKCLGEAIIVVSKIPFLFTTVNFKMSLCFSDFLVAYYKYYYIGCLYVVHFIIREKVIVVQFMCLHAFMP